MRERVFRPLMAGVIAARYAVLAGVVVALSSQLALLVSGDVQWRFFNAPERPSVTGNFAMAPGATRADTLEQMRMLQQATERLAANTRPSTAPTRGLCHGRDRGQCRARPVRADTKEPDQLGGISIELIEADLRPYSSFAFVGELQERRTRTRWSRRSAFAAGGRGPGGDSLDVQFSGPMRRR